MANLHHFLQALIVAHAKFPVRKTVLRIGERPWAWPHERAIDSNARQLPCIPCCLDMVFQYSCGTNTLFWKQMPVCVQVAQTWGCWSPLVLPSSHLWVLQQGPYFLLAAGGNLSQTRLSADVARQRRDLLMPAVHSNWHPILSQRRE